MSTSTPPGAPLAGAGPSEPSQAPALSEPRGFYKVWHWLADRSQTERPHEARAARLALANPKAMWRLLRDMPVGLALYDENFRIVYQNPASEVMTGYPIADVAGQTPFGLWVPEEERRFAEDHLRRMREERVAMCGRAMHIRRDHTQSWVQWYTEPVFEGERFAGYLGLHTNLSEEVREARQQAEMLIDAAYDFAFVQISATGRIQSWNRNAAALFGREAKEVLGVPIDVVFLGNGANERLPAAMLATSHSGNSAEYEGWLVHGSKGRFWGNLRLYPEHDEDGATVAHALVARDLSELRSAEEQRRESEALLNAIVSAASDAILGLDETGRVVLANPAAERIFGRSAGTLQSGPLPELLADIDPQWLLEQRRTLSGRADDGRFRHLEVSAARTNAGSRSLLTLVIRDVTERVESEQAVHRYREQLSALTRELLEAEQKTSRRLAQLLHDQLGQNFTSLRIFVDALRARLPSRGDDVAERAWTEVSLLIDRGMREVRNVLVELRPALLEDQGLAVALDNEAQSQAAPHPGVRVEFNAARDLVDRRWEAGAEYAAFMVAREAIGNALRHSKCTRVEIGLEAAGAAGFRLTIRDDGEGLTASRRIAKPGHLGLVGMRERALGIGAELNAISTEGVRGTTMELRYPS